MQTTTDLNPASYNPRKISASELERLRKQLKEFGDLGGIVFNVRTGRLVGGHQRVSALQDSWPIEKQPFIDDTGTVASGHIETPFGRFSYREVDWDEPREKLANLAANNQAGEFDGGKVKDMLSDLKLMDLDLELSGFDSGFLEKLDIPPASPEVNEWDLSDIEDNFWIVVRGPVSDFIKVRDALRQVETKKTVVESSL